MDSSKKLGKIIGLYMIIVGIAIVWHEAAFKELIGHVMQDKALVFVTGFSTLMIGLIVVVLHNVWQWNWRLINTLVGWVALLKGLNLILYPAAMDGLTLFFLQNNGALTGIACVEIILGCYLSYFSFCGGEKIVCCFKRKHE